ncbi:MAG: TrmH family RNA methyltransferase [Brevinema sp.]
MISPKKFSLLGNNQKIYKIASSVRSLENALKRGEDASPEEIFAYCALINDSPDRKIKEALAILSPLRDLPADLPYKEKIKRFNFAFHQLLEILDKKEDSDAKFSFLRFDRDTIAQRYPWAIILDNLRSPMNIGSVFRSGDGFGVGEISLCGICPHPPNPKVSRTAMGAEELIPWKYFAETHDAIAYWREQGYTIYALEVAEPSLMLEEVCSFEKVAFIIGNEEFGITEKTLELVDHIVQIPMSGIKNSLNAANCFAVLAYEAQRFFREEHHDG